MKHLFMKNATKRGRMLGNGMFSFLAIFIIQVKTCCPYVFYEADFIRKTTTFYFKSSSWGFCGRTFDKGLNKKSSKIWMNTIFLDEEENTLLNSNIFLVKEVKLQDHSQLDKVAFFLANRYATEDRERVQNPINMKNMKENMELDPIFMNYKANEKKDLSITQELLKEKSNEVRKLLYRAMNYMETRLFIAFYPSHNDIEIVGIVALTRVPSSIVLPHPLHLFKKKSEERFLISDLFVERQSRRKGIGTLLLSYAEKMARQYRASTKFPENKRNNLVEKENSTEVRSVHKEKNKNQRKRIMTSKNRHFKEETKNSTSATLVLMFVEQNNLEVPKFYLKHEYSIINDLAETFSLDTSRYTLLESEICQKNVMTKAKQMTKSNKEVDLLMRQNEVFQFNEFGPFFNFTQQTNMKELLSNHIYYKWLSNESLQ